MILIGSNDNSRIWPTRLLIVVLVLHSILLAYGGWIHSPTWDELGHMGAGMIHWKTGNFETYRVNPPLVRCLATLPVCLAGAESPEFDFSYDPSSRVEFSAGTDFVKKNGMRSFWYFSLARWFCIPWSLFGAIICFRWANELFTGWAGLFAATMWCFCPSIIGYGQFITPDVAAAATGVFVFYCFWHWLKVMDWRNAAWTGFALGLAELTKLTWVVLFPLLPLFWLFWQLSNRENCVSFQMWKRSLVQLAGIILIGIYILNMGYLFEGTLIPLERYTFVSSAMSGKQDSDGSPLQGNRFEGALLGKIPVPLPANYLRGIDLQRSDFERPRWSYLAGEWRDHGWWYYYLYAFGIKLPIGTLLLFALAIVAVCCGAYRDFPRRDILILLLPAIVMFLFISSQTGLSRHHRYALVVLPFLFICVSGLMSVTGSRQRLYKTSALVLLGWSIAASLWYYPHSMSYFNMLIGGPKNGGKHLIDSNIDWGQDMLILKHWYDRHPEARPLGIATKLPEYLMGLEDYGFEDCTVPSGVLPENELQDPQGIIGPQPGWYALSVARLYSKQEDYHYFLDLHPVDRVGYSTYVYYIDRETADQIRSKLGFPELPPIDHETE